MVKLGGACLSVLGVLGGCGGGARHLVVTAREVPGASGAPSIARVVDLGDLGAIPTTGPLPAFDSDGVFSVGELVLIEGDDFGKLPTVQIGGRPSAVVARTGSGAIIARIPPGVPSGEIAVEVSHPAGRHQKAISVVRWGAVVQPGGAVHLLRFADAGTPERFATLDLPGARDVAFSTDGQACYVLAQARGGGSEGSLAIVVTTAGGGPRVIRHLRLPMAAPLALAAAAEAPLLAIVDAHHGLLVDLEDPRRPALHEPFALELQPGRVAPQAIALDHQGRTLAVLVAQGNQLVPFDLRRREQPVRGAVLAVAPGVRHPVASGLTYAPSGDELWIAAGDTALSIAGGHQPTRLIAVAVAHGTAAPFAPPREAPVAGAAAPVVVATARRQTVAPGTAIRSQSRTAAVVMASVDPGLLRLGSAPAQQAPAVVLDAVAEPGAVLRTDLEGDAASLFRTAGVVTGVAVSHDSQQVAAATTRIAAGEGGARLEFGVTLVPLAGGASIYLRLGDVSPTAALLALAPVALAP
jgi:hypothetical protein